MDEKKSEKEAKKIVSEDVDKFFRDVWGKVVEYASLGAEEATKLSSTAKTRVDVETLKFKRGKVIKMLGERYLELCEKTPSHVLPGTREILKDIQGIDKEIRALEKEMNRARKPEKKKAASAAPRKSTAKKTASGKTPIKKKAPAKKSAPKKPGAPAPEPPKSPETGK